MADTRRAVDIDGLAALRRDLRKMRPDLLAEVRGVLKEAGQIVAVRGAHNAPRGTRPIPASRRPHVRLAQSLRAGTSGNAALVRSRALYGPKIERRTGFLATALAESEDEIVDAVGDGLDVLALRHGWH